jgi:hypothetical protein
MAKHHNISLHMGFINTPYLQENLATPFRAAEKEEKRKRKRGFSRTMTAEKLSKILESKYGIVETFSGVYEEEIKSLMHEGFREVAENIISTRKAGETTVQMKKLMNPYTKQIESMFRTFIDNEEMNGMVPGVPTKVSIKGRGRRRPGPSFIRTGIYKASFRAWVK